MQNIAVEEQPYKGGIWFFRRYDFYHQDRTSFNVSLFGLKIILPPRLQDHYVDVQRRLRLRVYFLKKKEETSTKNVKDCVETTRYYFL